MVEMWVNRSKWSNQLLRLLGWMLMFNMIHICLLRSWSAGLGRTQPIKQNCRKKFEIREYQPYLVAEVYMGEKILNRLQGMGSEFWRTTSLATISRVLQRFKWLEKQRKRAKALR